MNVTTDYFKHALTLKELSEIVILNYFKKSMELLGNVSPKIPKLSTYPKLTNRNVRRKKLLE